MQTIRLGTRGSRLALRQAGLVAAALSAAGPGIVVETVTIKTAGDAVLDRTPAAIGDRGLFTKEIEQALLDRTIDLAAHSCKDLPSELAPGLAIAGVLSRENPCDALLSHRGFTLDALPHGGCVGTSSLRRTAQILALRPDIRVVPLRGNVETRIRKMQDEGLDAIVLARAGIVRLGLTDFVTQVLPADLMVPAPGQGAIAIEARTGDAGMQALLVKIHDAPAGCEVAAERAFLRRLQGGCQVPVGCLAQAEGDGITVTGLIASLDGRKVFKDNCQGSAGDAEQLGAGLAERLLAAGADSVLRELCRNGL